MGQPVALVPSFHGTNCDTETLRWLESNLEVKARPLEESTDTALDPKSVACVVVPGGFSYGDYLRAGALAARGTKMKAVERFARAGVPVLGICNGFQILCEAGLLPGVLLRNANRQHNHFPVELKTDFAAIERAEKNPATAPVWLPRLTGPHGAALRAHYDRFCIPMSCGMGNYLPPPSLTQGNTLAPAAEKQLVPLFRYVHNENGAFDSIASIASADGKIMGLMPHPERASELLLGGDQGLFLLLGLAQNTGVGIRPQSALAAFSQRLAQSAGDRA